MLTVEFEGKNVKETLVSEVGHNEMILDLHLEEETVALLEDAKTILWNGPLGVFEFPNFSEGTIAAGKSIAEAIRILSRESGFR